jgi:hypothetical protein
MKASFIRAGKHALSLLAQLFHSIIKFHQSKIMKKYILGLALTVVLLGCGNKEKEALQVKVDSLRVQLAEGREAEENMKDVGILIDSIDASRKSLQVRMIEGNSYADYVGRLQNINRYIKQTEAKLYELEKSSSHSSKVSARAIRAYKADLAKQSSEILDLQLRLVTEHDQNMKLWVKINEKDSILSMKDQIIKMNENDITSLEKLFNDTQTENKSKVANLYYAQAEALEVAANRTQFAPRKKKATRLEALELYKLSLSLGKTDAQQKINELEKKLS